jgi:hypothetical protein
VLISLCIYCIVPVYIVELANYSYYHANVRYSKAEHYKIIEQKLLRTVDTLALVCNIFSCSILALVMRLLHKRTKSVEVG